MFIIYSECFITYSEYWYVTKTWVLIASWSYTMLFAWYNEPSFPAVTDAFLIGSSVVRFTNMIR